MTTEFFSSAFGDTNATSSSFAMPPMEDPFPAVDYGFDAGNSMPSLPFDSDSDKPARADPSVMWGGMSQLSLQQPSADDWAADGAPMSGGMYGHGVNHITQYGQVTPPNDNTADIDPRLEKSEPGQPQQQEEEEEDEGAEHVETPAKTRKASSGRTRREAAATKRKPKPNDEAPASDAPPKRKSAKSTRKARMGYKAMTKEEEDDSDGEAKREKFLERNRVAASKCRAKKKEWTSGLESQARDLAAQNASLHAYALQLRDEVLWLKGECLRHTDCDCKRIRDYLDRSIAQMHPSGALSGGGGVLPQPGGSQYRKPSEASVYTFDTASTSATGGSRQGSLAHESDAGGDGGPSLAPSEQEIQAMLEASIASPAMAESPRSSASTCGDGTG